MSWQNEISQTLKTMSVRQYSLQVVPFRVSVQLHNTLLMKHEKTVTWAGQIVAVTVVTVAKQVRTVFFWMGLAVKKHRNVPTIF